jgi:hypothetical protein
LLHPRNEHATLPSNLASPNQRENTHDCGNTQQEFHITHMATRKGNQNGCRTGVCARDCVDRRTVQTPSHRIHKNTAFPRCGLACGSSGHLFLQMRDLKIVGNREMRAKKRGTRVKRAHKKPTPVRPKDFAPHTSHRNALADSGQCVVAKCRFKFALNVNTLPQPGSLHLYTSVMKIRDGLRLCRRKRGLREWLIGNEEDNNNLSLNSKQSWLLKLNEG